MFTFDKQGWIGKWCRLHACECDDFEGDVGDEKVTHNNFCWYIKTEYLLINMLKLVSCIHENIYLVFRELFIYDRIMS